MPYHEAMRRKSSLVSIGALIGIVLAAAILVAKSSHVHRIGAAADKDLGPTEVILQGAPHDSGVARTGQDPPRHIDAADFGLPGPVSVSELIQTACDRAPPAPPEHEVSLSMGWLVRDAVHAAVPIARRCRGDVDDLLAGIRACGSRRVHLGQYATLVSALVLANSKREAAVFEWLASELAATEDIRVVRVIAQLMSLRPMPADVQPGWTPDLSCSETIPAGTLREVAAAKLESLAEMLAVESPSAPWQEFAAMDLARGLGPTACIAQSVDDTFGRALSRCKSSLVCKSMLLSIGRRDDSRAIPILEDLATRGLGGIPDSHSLAIEALALRTSELRLGTLLQIARSPRLSESGRTMILRALEPYVSDEQVAGVLREAILAPSTSASGRAAALEALAQGRRDQSTVDVIRARLRVASECDERVRCALALGGIAMARSRGACDALEALVSDAEPTSVREAAVSGLRTAHGPEAHEALQRLALRWRDDPSIGPILQGVGVATPR